MEFEANIVMLVRAGFLCVLEKALPARAKLAGAH